ncbi:uncharacterized protein TM35_000362040 [Trypanosoma theileri]|uniref:Uncharacterized protein n=1 Tax=Trypanosoma theileri TaxID=67003 RepID=A0A1X0NKQ0_9TRYP|nr:uncharacterized protein TM35_000362040 [Trypanosoma theileri]ORC85344.1 hypothetical protein TM35_000362040 [Trypanosoma theileri]
MDFMHSGRNWRFDNDGMRASPSIRRSSGGGIGLVRSEHGAFVHDGVSKNIENIEKNYTSKNVIASSEISSESRPSALTQWTEWSQQSSFSCNRDPSTLSSERTSTAVERELLRTKEVLMQYKSYVEKRLMRYIKELEDDRTQRDKLCDRLKRDNVLLLEELNRFRSGTAAAQRTKYQNSTFQTFPTREESLLQELQKEQARRAQLEAVHADTVARLQQQVDQFKQDRHSGVDAHTIQNLRDVLTQRDDEIRQLRKLYSLPSSEPTGSAQPSTVGVTGIEGESVALEVQQMATDAIEFISAMNDAASTITNNNNNNTNTPFAAITHTTNSDSHTNVATIESNTYFADVGHMWEDLSRLSTSPLDNACNTPYRSSHLLSMARSLRCTLEEEHNQIALFVRKILRENEDLNVQLTRERHEREMERQTATYRLNEVEEESAALIQQLRQQLHFTTQQRGSSWLGRNSQSLQREQDKTAWMMFSDDTQRCDIGTQTLLSVELSQLMQMNKGQQLVSTSISNEQFMNQLSQVLSEMEILERDNAEKSILLAQLQQQRERFLAGVDTELAHSLPTRASLTSNFGQYLLR